MSSAIAVQNGSASIDDAILNDEKLWQVVSSGDLKGLSAKQKSDYFLYRCRQEGLNPASQPFQYMTLQGKEILYAGKTAADQLRKQHGISITNVTCRDDGDYIECEVRVRDREGREDYEAGIVFVGQLKGVDRANAKMKAITKAKRRATYSICGTGVMDETEIETIPGAQRGSVVREEFAGTEIPEEAPRPAQATQRGPATIAAGAVNRETGEIETMESIAADIKEARGALGWSARNVQEDADREGITIRTRDGLVLMRDRLQSMCTAEEERATQPPIIIEGAVSDAQGEAGADRWTGR